MKLIFSEKELSRKPWRKNAAEAFVKGLKRHTSVETINDSSYLGDELSLSWGHHGGANNLVLESGFTNNYSFSQYEAQRNYFISTVWRGNHNEGEWALRDSRPSDRAKKHGALLKDYKSTRQTAIIFGQCPGDKAIRRVNGRYEHFLQDLIKKASKTFPQVYFRPHPRAKVKLRRTTIHEGTLTDAIQKADICITYSSTAAIDCLLAGVPAIVLGNYSVAREVSSNSLDKVIRPDRTPWLNKLFYAQWTHAEMETGESWEVLREGYNAP